MKNCEEVIKFIKDKLITFCYDKDRNGNNEEVRDPIAQVMEDRKYPSVPTLKVMSLNTPFCCE